MIKLTNVLALEMVLGMEEVKSNLELVEKLEKMKAQFEKKNNSATGNGKPSKTQLENEKIKVQLLEFLEGQENALQIKEIQLDSEFSIHSNQKISALLKQLVESGKVEKIVEKRISKFQINRNVSEVESI